MVEHGVVFYLEPAHVTVAMEPVIWERLLMPIIVYAIQVFLGQSVELKYVLVDVLINGVAF